MSKNGKIAAGGFAVLLLVLVGIGVIVAQQISDLTVVSNLAEGDCVKDHFKSSDGEFTEVLLISTSDCDGEHALEVFAVSESVFSSTEYPGSNEAFALGLDGDDFVDPRVRNSLPEVQRLEGERLDPRVLAQPVGRIDVGQ